MLQGKSDHEVFAPATAEQFTSNDQRAIEHHAGIQIIETLAHDDGTHESIVSKFPISDCNGTPVSIGGIAIDITPQRRAQIALQQSQERLDLATSAAKIGTFDWDIPTGRVVWNQQEEALFGLGPGTFEGTIEHWALRVHPEDLPTMQRRMTDAMTQRTPELTFAFRIIRPEGSCRWIEGAARYFYAPDGSPLRMVGVNIDMTERRDAEMTLQRLNAELEEFAYAVSHDLKEPLRMVNTYTELLLRRHIPEDASAQQYAHYIRTGVSRTEALINDLLAYSRTIHTENEADPVCDLGAALAKALLVLDESIRNTEASIRYATLPTVVGEEGQLAQVFQNLLGNSLKYHHQDRAPCIRIRATKEGVFWRITLVDNGIGFDPQYAQRIFGLFKRLHKDEYPGTGLGLAICKRIIERHGGSISAESTPGEGSTFTFTVREVRATNIL